MSIFLDKQINNPLIQAISLLLANLLFMLFSWAAGYTGLSKFDALFPWSVAAAFLLFYAMINSLLSLRADSFAKYWGSSMYGFIGLAFGSAVMAWGFSGIRFGDAGTYRWIFIVVSICFLVFLSMVNFMKTIVTFAEREEWNEPRKKNR